MEHGPNRSTSLYPHCHHPHPGHQAVVAQTTGFPAAPLAPPTVQMLFGSQTELLKLQIKTMLHFKWLLTMLGLKAKRTILPTEPSISTVPVTLASC